LAKNTRPIVEQATELAAAPLVLYIDKHRLGRDYISEHLARQLSQWTVESLASMSELKKEGDWSNESLVVLHAHSASVGTAEIAGEIAMIAEVAPGVPFVVMSDREDAAEALLAIRSGARGYLPASLPLSQVIAAIRFVAEGEHIFRHPFSRLRLYPRGHHPLRRSTEMETRSRSHRVNGRCWSD
jgi:DNA-binding NarL/FixJ family response regulator